jgi:hypothetical protein
LRSRQGWSLSSASASKVLARDVTVILETLPCHSPAFRRLGPLPYSLGELR